MTTRLTITMSRCQGYGMCSLIAPRLIRLDRWGFPIIESLSLEDPANLLAAMRAVSACPAQALSLRHTEEPSR